MTRTRVEVKKGDIPLTYDEAVEAFLKILNACPGEWCFGGPDNAKAMIPFKNALYKLEGEARDVNARIALD